MKKIIIKTVPKKEIRNDSVGDYKKKNGKLEILVAKSRDPIFDMGVAIHELVESVLAIKRGISFSKITKFDKENKDKSGQPGEMKGAPYFKEHAVANKIESILVKELKKK